MPAYSVYCRCLSAVRLPPGDAVRFVNPDAPFPSVEVRSRYMPAPAQEVALDLLIETRLVAPDLEAAACSNERAAVPRGFNTQRRDAQFSGAGLGMRHTPSGQ